MKFRSLVASWIVRALTSTLRVRHVHAEHIENTPQYILAFWHRQLIPLLGKARWKGPITVGSSLWPMLVQENAVGQSGFSAEPSFVGSQPSVGH